MEIYPHVDIMARFNAEVKELPAEISLRGSATLQAIARQLLKGHDVKIVERGAEVQLMSMEEYGTLFLAAFLENMEFPKGHHLLYTIPELELQLFAERHNITWVDGPKSDIRIMLDNIAQEQPQTYFSLLRSAQRLQAFLRNGKSN